MQKTTEFETIKIVPQGTTEFKGIKLTEINKFNNSFPTLSRYDKKSLEELSECVVKFERKVNEKSGIVTYCAIAYIENTFTEEFKTDPFAKKTGPNILDEPTYDAIAILRKVPSVSFASFRARCRYRLSVGTSKKGFKFLILELVCAKNKDGSLITLSKILQSKRFNQLALHQDWFDSGMKVYNRGDSELIDDEEETSENVIE